MIPVLSPIVMVTYLVSMKGRPIDEALLFVATGRKGSTDAAVCNMQIGWEGHSVGRLGGEADIFNMSEGRWVDCTEKR